MNSDEQFAQRYRAWVDAAAFGADRTLALWQRITEALEGQENPHACQSRRNVPSAEGGETL